MYREETHMEGTSTSLPGPNINNIVSVEKLPAAEELKLSKPALETIAAETEAAIQATAKMGN